ncbi:response regulator [Actinocrispum wychmicini]|uniref:DNA-binding NarL/FixJ family response regulator n=1 Tax=Actinocrispum wychmicini TaxID=1213861 RepID=A0A4R2JTD3_9PSEU|nr:response regulator transcription factor [Actinocrispum wychmicini]TCO62894.1 DNA-binding NarL/FixJ family response regulator [Actinocrispum wychmicini]
MTKVLIVDEHDLLRSGLTALLRQAPAGYEVIEASTGTQAVATATAERPDVILIDIRMPGMDGVTATSKILSAATETPPRVLILTTFDHDEYVRAALGAGASGVLLKTLPAERLFAAIEAVAAGDLPFTPGIARRLIRAFTRDMDAAPAPSADLAAVTNREREVLRLVARGLSNGDIANRLTLAEATVKTHLYRAMTKIGVRSRTQAVVYAYRMGLVPSIRQQ